MTEFDLALDFLQAYVRAATPAAGEGVPFDDGREFRGFCGGLGLEPTPERGELARDLAGVINDCLRRGEHEPDEDADEPCRRLIPAESLAAGLERLGWRTAYLAKDVGD